MVPYNAERNLEHQVTSILTSDASSDGHSPANRSFAGSQDAGVVAVDEELIDQQLFFVTSYSDFDKLAHGPRGHAAKHTLRVYRFLTDGSLVLLHIGGEGAKVINPAFSRFHPRLVNAMLWLTCLLIVSCN